MARQKSIRIRQIRSAIGTRPEHRELLRTLGLRKIRHEVERADTPAIRSAIARVAFLVEVVEG